MRPQCAHQRERRLIGLDAVLLQLLEKVSVLEIAERAHALHVRSVFGCTQRQLDPA